MATENSNQGAKQQIAERINASTNILVTVSTSPSVDELAAALGLTSMLNGLDKHATAVVSGDIPPAISFLDPEKTFENTVDSLRDFIIALDKEKADHLRYKVEGDVVKIFITPYRTTLSSDDLEFSQGDYNVELVLALGVKDKNDLDKALTAHGRILHDATVATVSCGDTPSDLGTIDWFEPNASSLSEMLVSLSESFKADGPVLNEQNATAFLTGLVASTDRFSNNKTTSKVMTMAAQLMAAGANQQLIAAKLEEAHEIGPEQTNQAHADGTTDLAEGESTKVDATKAAAKDDGSLTISHEEAEVPTDAKTAEEELAEQLNAVAPGVTPATGDLAYELTQEAKAGEKESVLPPVVAPEDGEPTLGGTLNATTEQAHEDSEREANDPRNKTILSHESGEYVGDQQPTFEAPFNATANNTAAEPSSVDIFNNGPAPTVNLDQPGANTSAVLPPEPHETLADLEQKTREEAHADAQAQVQAALDAAPFDPANNPTEALGAQPLGGELHQELPPPPLEAPVLSEPMPAPVEPAPVLPPLPGPVPTEQPAQAAPPPLDFSVLPPPPPPPSLGPPSGPLPPEQLGQIFGDAPATPAPQQPDAPKDPNQFTIPGQ
ncbi:MAG TPA: hypothetical protein PL051_04885 [Candidatus Saccharibacteria bacterium]|nr:hypothetical protein [Candidatus Saccharibacteria bacterium]